MSVVKQKKKRIDKQRSNEQRKYLMEAQLTVISDKGD